MLKIVNLATIHHTIYHRPSLYRQKNELFRPFRVLMTVVMQKSDIFAIPILVDSCLTKPHTTNELCSTPNKRRQYAPRQPAFLFQRQTPA